MIAISSFDENFFILNYSPNVFPSLPTKYFL